MVEETGVNHWPAASHWQTLSHNVVSIHLTMSRTQTHNVGKGLNVEQCKTCKMYK
jgi:hypothetical protein